MRAEGDVKQVNKFLIVAVVGITALFVAAGTTCAQEERYAGKLYIAMGPSKQVKVVDVATNKVVNTIDIGREPHGIAVTHAGNLVLVPSIKESDLLTLIDADSGKLKGTIALGKSSHHLAISPDDRFAYISLVEG